MARAAKRRMFFFVGALILALAAGAGVAGAAPAQWNLASDFRLYPKAANPNPGALGPRIWYFMESSSLTRDPGSYTLLGEFITDRFHVPNLQSWQGDDVFDEKNALPSVSFNATGSAQSPFGIDWPAATIVVHPLYYAFVVVGWRSPTAGVVAVAGSVTDRHVDGGDGIDWSVDRGGTTLVSGTIPNGGAASFAAAANGALDAVRVAKGEFLYFVVGPGPFGDFGYDSTGLDVTITMAARPEDDQGK